MNSPSRDGFTLLEIAFAVVVLGLAALPIMGLMSGGARITRSTLDEVLASSFASDVLEQLEASGVRALASEAALTTADGTLQDGVQIPGGAGRFHLGPVPAGLTIALRLSTPGSGLRQATVTASRSDQGQAPLRVRLDAVIEGEEP